MSDDAAAAYKRRYRKANPDYVRRDYERHAERRKQTAKAYREAGKGTGPDCQGCGWRLLEPCESGLCGFCEEEQGLRSPA